MKARRQQPKTPLMSCAEASPLCARYSRNAIQVTVTDSKHIIVPLTREMREQLRVKTGDRVHVTAANGVVTSMAASPDGLTGEQRQKIIAEVDEARKGSYHGPFSSTTELESFLASWKGSRKPRD